MSSAFRRAAHVVKLVIDTPAGVLASSCAIQLNIVRVYMFTVKVVENTLERLLGAPHAAPRHPTPYAWKRLLAQRLPEVGGSHRFA